MNATRVLKSAIEVPVEEVTEILRQSAPTARSTMPEVGFIEEDLIQPDHEAGERIHSVRASDANDPTVLYRFRFSDSDLESFSGEGDLERLAGAVAHMDRCAKGVFN